MFIRSAVLTLTTAALVAVAASPVSAAPVGPPADLPGPPQWTSKRPPLPKGARPHTRRRVRARPATYSLSYDAKVDCYPTWGGVVGGGSDNNSVASSLWWNTRDGRTYLAYHQFVLENWVNGSTYWVTTDRSAFPGPYLDRPGGYHVGPNGILERTQYSNNFGFGTVTTMSPWTWEQGFLKSVRSYVRGWVKMWVYTPEAGWEQTPWKLATVVGDTVQVPGWCSM